LSAFVQRLAPVAPRAPDVAGTINLSSAGPDADLFPYRTWTRLIRRHLRRVRPEVFRYGRAAAGLDVLRDALAAYLRRSRAVQCRAEQIVIVSGSQQALDLCGRVLIDPGDEVIVEEPGYTGARQLFAAVGARIRPVAVDDDGLRTASLAPARIACVTPSHEFPLGVSLSLGRRLELLAWAEASKAFIIEDDYDSEFRYSGAPLPALQGLGDGSRVVYVGTFSNAMFPGLRIGYLVLPPALVDPFLRARWYADRQTGSLEQAALADFVREGHLEQHLRRMRRVYKARREALLEALARRFGARAIVMGDAAGMHLVVRFDDAGLARRRGVTLMKTREYYAGEPREDEYIIRFAGLSERALGEAVRRLAREVRTER
jgi:GntR family transcriptional regulator/MocR family aminotransferase